MVKKILARATVPVNCKGKCKYAGINALALPVADTDGCEKPTVRVTAAKTSTHLVRTMVHTQLSWLAFVEAHTWGVNDSLRLAEQT